MREKREGKGEKRRGDPVSHSLLAIPPLLLIPLPQHDPGVRGEGTEGGRGKKKKEKKRGKKGGRRRHPNFAIIYSATSAIRTEKP